MLYIADYVEELMDAVVKEVLLYEHVKVPPSLASNIKKENPVPYALKIAFSASTNFYDMSAILNPAYVRCPMGNMHGYCSLHKKVKLHVLTFPSIHNTNESTDGMLNISFFCEEEPSSFHGLADKHYMQFEGSMDPIRLVEILGV